MIVISSLEHSHVRHQVYSCSCLFAAVSCLFLVVCFLVVQRCLVFVRCVIMRFLSVRRAFCRSVRREPCFIGTP
jgi:hypothetical protein